MPEIRIGRIIRILSIPTILEMLSTSTEGKMVTATEMESKLEITNTKNILFASIRSEGSSV